MRAEEARIAVYGAGAMGTVLGALLTKGGLNVDLITRNKEHVQGLKEGGATVEYVAEGKEETVKVNALLPSEMSGEYDVIFLMTKQRYNEETLTYLLPYLKEDGVVCTTQNGLPEQSVAEIVGCERTYGGATSYGGTFIGEGKAAMTSKISAMRMEVGGYQNDGSKLPLLKEILSYVGKATSNGEFVKTTDNLLGARWSKLAINAAFSGLSVVTGMTFGRVAKKGKSRKIALRYFARVHSGCQSKRRYPCKNARARHGKIAWREKRVTAFHRVHGTPVCDKKTQKPRIRYAQRYRKWQEM